MIHQILIFIRTKFWRVVEKRSRGQEEWDQGTMFRLNTVIIKEGRVVLPEGRMSEAQTILCEKINK